MGKRKTVQRDAIRRVFEEENRPLTPNELLELVQVVVPSLGIATVYRAIKDFLAEEWLVAVSVAGTTRYERANKGHHHHFHCGECNKTFDIEGCVGDLQSLVPEAFTVLSHELTIIGMCHTCNGATAS